MSKKPDYFKPVKPEPETTGFDELKPRHWVWCEYDDVTDKINFAIVPHCLDMPTGYYETRQDAIAALQKLAKDFYDATMSLTNDNCDYTAWRKTNPTAKNSEYLASKGFLGLNFSDLIE